VAAASAAYSSPGYEQRLAAARDGRAADFAPAGQVIPGWPGGRQHPVSYRVEFGGGAQGSCAIAMSVTSGMVAP